MIKVVDLRATDERGNVFPDVDGTVLDVVRYNQRNGVLSLLVQTVEEAVEVEKTEQTGDITDLPTEFESEPDDAGDENDVVYCAGKKSDDSQCTREVDEPGDTCWQH